tara:strand:- start:523 stop:951 length:429 start_codon:yes stop_codon:yes gene_type:complete
MSWEDIVKKETRVSGGDSLDLQDGKELITENLDITIELKEVSGDFTRKPRSYGGDIVSDRYKPNVGFTEFGSYEYAFLPKLKGYAELYDGDILIRKFKAEEIEVFFEGGSFKNIKTFPVPITFTAELDYDDTPIIYITMQVA